MLLTVKVVVVKIGVVGSQVAMRALPSPFDLKASIAALLFMHLPSSTA
jgi:hypothetical protein